MVDKLNKILVFVGLTWLTPVIKLAAGEKPRSAGPRHLDPDRRARECVRLLPDTVVADRRPNRDQLGQYPRADAGLPASGRAVGRARGRTGKKRGRSISGRKSATPRNWPQTHRPKSRSANTPASRRISTRSALACTTVFAGFSLAALVAVPIGLFCGMSRTIMNAFNPLIQIFKPVSPLAWLPLVTMVVSALYTTNDGLFCKVLYQLGGHRVAVLAVARADQHRLGCVVAESGLRQCGAGAQPRSQGPDF